MIEMLGMVRIDGKPFVQISLDGKPIGQLTLRDAMNHGTRSIMAAIEAERDAAVVRQMVDADRSEEEIAAQLTAIRTYRDSIDPDPEATVLHPRFPHG